MEGNTRPLYDVDKNKLGLRIY